MQNNWLKQSKEQPLFPDILWSRPENKRLAGKLFIAGGNLHKFTAVSEAYAAASEAGVVRVLLPDALAKTIGKVLPEANYASSTLSGGFGRQALAEMLDGAEWADATLLAGDFGRGSETTITLESFAEKYSGPLTLSGDSLDPFGRNLASLVERGNLLLVAELARLQKLLAGQVAIKQSGNLHQLVETLNDWSAKAGIHVLTAHEGQAVVSCGGRTSTTPVMFGLNKMAARAAIFWLQNPKKPFEAITTAIL